MRSPLNSAIKLQKVKKEEEGLKGNRKIIHSLSIDLEAFKTTI